MSQLTKRSPSYISPENMEEAMSFAKVLADSGMVPKDYAGKPKAIMVAVQMGAEVGLSPMQALQNIAVINGRPSIWGDAMLALVSSHPDCEDVVEKYDSKSQVATCTIKRRGRNPVVRSFSKEDAIKAELWDGMAITEDWKRKKSPWVKYPERMLQMRARSWACRDAFPDALRGLYSAEEAQDIEPQTYVVETQQKPKLPPKPQSQIDEFKEQLVEDTKEVFPEAEVAIDDGDGAVVVSTRSEPEDSASPENTVITFGKNNGKKLGELSEKSLLWYAQNAKDETVRNDARMVCDNNGIDWENDRPY